MDSVRRIDLGSFQLPASSFQPSPFGVLGVLEAGSWKPEAGSRKLEAGSWKLEAGSWKLEAESSPTK
jgi:hypothetical protein